jgi:hypothetical protein
MPTAWKMMPAWEYASKEIKDIQRLLPGHGTQKSEDLGK